MNKQTAVQKGLRFTGVYDHSKDSVKPRLEEIRKKGYKAYLVTVPQDPLSRGYHGTGYSVYAELKYFQDETAEKMRIAITGHQSRMDAVIEKHKRELQQEVEQLNREHQQRIDWMIGNGYSL